MKNIRGFARSTVLLVLLAVVVLGSVGYVAANPGVIGRMSITKQQTIDDGIQTEPGDHLEIDRETSEGFALDAKSSISWKFDTAEVDGIPQTKVIARVNGTEHAVGTFAGSCAEIGVSGGVDGKGLLPGELAASQCWYAGGGSEIGVFAHEDGGYDVMVGELSEGSEEGPFFRGNFRVVATVQL